MRGGLSRSRAFSESICAFLGARDVFSPDILSIAFAPARSYITIDPASLQTPSLFPGKTSAQATEPFSSARSARQKRAAALSLALRGVDRRGVRGCHALCEQRRRACLPCAARLSGRRHIKFSVMGCRWFLPHHYRLRASHRLCDSNLLYLQRLFPLRIAGQSAYAMRC